MHSTNVASGVGVEMTNFSLSKLTCFVSFLYENFINDFVFILAHEIL